MKKINPRKSLIVAFFVILAISCQENEFQNEVQSTEIESTPLINLGQIKAYSFDGSEGDPISLDTAKVWVKNNFDKNSQTKGHFVGGEILSKLLAQDGCMGIRFYYAIDELGDLQILLKGADVNGNDISGSIPTVKAILSSGDIIGGVETLDSKLGENITEKIYQDRTTNYTRKYSNTISAHFFGYQIINSILSENGCVGIRMHLALNGTQVPQLLLIGADKNGKALLPTSSEMSRTKTDNTIADVSYPCPSYCSGT